ncbi:MAG: WD40 repeat domain-containing protein [Planctomycetota bacterium]
MVSNCYALQARVKDQRQRSMGSRRRWTGWLFLFGLVLCELLSSAGWTPGAGWQGWSRASFAADQAGPDYQRVDVILRKYCGGCHNDQEREGKLSLASYQALLKGGEHGAVVTPGRSEGSRLWRVVAGRAEPRMPPADNAAPSAAEIAVLAAWIDAGAKGPTGQPLDPADLATPKIPLQVAAKRAVHALAISPDGNLLAVARHGEVELQSVANGQTVRRLPGPRGSVNSVTFSHDGKLLAAAGGEPNLFGEVRIWKVESDYPVLQTLRGHRDSLQAVKISPNGKWLASGGYDQTIKLWDLETGQELRTLLGHNGAVFDLSFRADSRILASASGDRTIKLWDVATGQRLDTLNQSLMELYCVAFSPDGRRLAAGGVDNRIRIWTISDSGQEGSNPLEVSQFAHELPVLRIAYAPDGQTLVSSSEDRLIKIWNAQSMTIRSTLAEQADWVVGLAVHPRQPSLLAGRLDGTITRLDLPAPATATDTPLTPLSDVVTAIDYGAQPALEELPRVTESEPNDEASQPTALTVPGVALGVIQTADGRAKDEDLWAFEARQGDQWIIETNARRLKSPVDTKIEVLDESGKAVPRLLLRAVRDSEIEFRSMDSNQRGVRLKYWEELLLNDYVYLNGEVIKHYQQRRGPDADGQFYPENGNRHAFFDTTCRTHALGEPAYVVVPYPVGTTLPNNGLPVFTLNYENDDDGQRKLGADSRLTFVAPATGKYLVRVSDVRGFAGADYRYELIVRRPRPDFTVTLTGANPTVNAGSGKEFTVKAERADLFAGPIQVDVTGLPPGFHVTSPVVIQPGLHEARGVISAAADAPAPTEANWAQTKITATGRWGDKTIVKEVNSLGTIKLGPKPKVLVHLQLDQPANALAERSPQEPGVVTIVPGRRASCRLRIERLEFKDRVQLEVFNLPHGVIVEDIGLNGVLIPEEQTERTIFLSCEPWVPAMERLFHAVAKVDGDQVSLPLQIRVVSPTEPVR